MFICSLLFHCGFCFFPMNVKINNQFDDSQNFLRIVIMSRNVHHIIILLSDERQIILMILRIFSSSSDISEDCSSCSEMFIKIIIICDFSLSISDERQMILMILRKF